MWLAFDSVRAQLDSSLTCKCSVIDRQVRT